MTELISGRKRKPSEVAKEMMLEKQIMKEKLQNNNLAGNSKVGLRQALNKKSQISNGTIQRYLRINYLIQDLQDDLDNGKITLISAEHLSFLGKKEQEIVHSLIADENKKISDLQAKKIKELYKEKDWENEKVNISDIKNIIEKKKTEEIEIDFSEEEINLYFEGIFDKAKIKNTILIALKKSKNR